MQPRPAINGIHHVSLVAPDVARTARFYTDVLGLRSAEGAIGDQSPASGRVWLGNESTGFITIAPSAGGRAGALGVGTIHHVALGVATGDALLKWKRWLQHKEVLLYGPYDQRAYQDIVFADPDGVLVEIATQGPGWQATQDGQEVYSPPKQSMAPFRNEELIAAQTWPQPVTRIEPDMALQGIHHVSTISSSLERTDAFYRDVLALPLVRKTIDSDDPEVERWYWGLDGGQPGSLVMAFPIVHPHEAGTAVQGRAGPGIALHYALNAGSPEALRGWTSALSAAGTDVTPGVDEAGDQAVRLHDPDGQVVELVTADLE
jgi:glyoxalase family protein